MVMLMVGFGIDHMAVEEQHTFFQWQQTVG